MSSEGGSPPVNPEPEKPAVVDRDLLAQTLEREAGRVFEYCRALVGREDVAVSVTEAALNSARSMLQDPDQLRAWLVDLTRRQTRASDAGDAASPGATPPAELAVDPAPDQDSLLPDSREVIELVYRHGIHREDLGAVLGVPEDEASALLAAAELELGRRELPGEPDPAEVAPGPADPTSGPMLADSDRLRAWLFALARQEALAVASSATAGWAAPGAELTRYTGSAAAGPEHELLPASWWQGSVTQPQPRRRLRIAALMAIPLALAIGLAVYLAGVSQPAGPRAAGAGRAVTGTGGLPRSVRPNAGLAVVAPRASASPTIPISALLPVSPSPMAQPSPSLPPPAPSPTPKPSPKPSPSPTPKPSPSPTPKSSSTPKSSATPKASG